MFATGLPSLALSFFSSASIIITVPSAVAVFAWIATIWLGRPVITTAFLFFASMIVLFVIGGVSGFMTASVPVDWQLTDTYFVVAHIHYVLIGINVFPVSAAFIYWFPKMTGRMLDERLGKWNFWTMFVGFNFGFLPMHLTGLLGMPRRIYTYPAAMGWDTLNMLTSIGAFVFAFGVLLLVINIVQSLRRGRLAGANPWDAATLGMVDAVAAPAYNFAVIPQVASRHPLWEDRLGESAARSSIGQGPVLDHGRETLATTPLDGEPDLILKMPEDSYAPFVLTVAITGGFTGLLVHWWWLARDLGLRCRRRAVGVAVAGAEISPDRECLGMTDTAFGLTPLPVGGIERRSLGWSGMLCLIATEAALFTYLLFSYFYFDVQLDASLAAARPPPLALALPNTFILLLSSIAAWAGERGVRRGARGQQLAGGAVALVLGIVFVVVQGFEWHNRVASDPVEQLRFALLHSHRLSHGPCRGGIGHFADGADLVSARLF